MRDFQLRRLVESALDEDLGPGDLTTGLLIPAGLRATAEVVARGEIVLSGTDVFAEVFLALDPDVKVDIIKGDSAAASPGEAAIRLEGPASSILTGERVALNFLGRLSGIATLTKAFVDRVEGTDVKILDTRKTTPGLRALEKRAVTHGGGHSHRTGLYDGILIKDNHIAAVGSVRKAVALAKRNFRQRVEVEVDTTAQLEEALEAGADIVLLDNMDPLALKDALRRTQEFYSPGARLTLLEASGGISLANVREAALSGVDFISIGALTHSAPVADLGLDFVPTGIKP
jgi:nicotinate-nucleotide pyrophosphorylase (carboxylating)